PEATIAALEACQARGARLWLLAGGHDKQAPLEGLAQAVTRHAAGAALFGAARERIAREGRRARRDFPTGQCETLGEALAWCWEQSRAGDAILLSPACASHDQFVDFAARGETFCRLVAELVARESALAV